MELGLQMAQAAALCPGTHRDPEPCSPPTQSLHLLCEVGRTGHVGSPSQPVRELPATRGWQQLPHKIEALIRSCVQGAWSRALSEARSASEATDMVTLLTSAHLHGPGSHPGEEAGVHCLGSHPLYPVDRIRAPSLSGSRPQGSSSCLTGHRERI